MESAFAIFCFIIATNCWTGNNDSHLVVYSAAWDYSKATIARICCFL